MTCKPRQFRTFRHRIKNKSHTLWRTGRIIKKGKDMKSLWRAAFERAAGYCENGCNRRIFENTAELHHVTKRSHGGSDVLENVQMLCHQCHAEKHGQPQWSAA